MADERHKARGGGDQLGTLSSPIVAIFPNSILGGRGRGTSHGKEPAAQPQR